MTNSEVIMQGFLWGVSCAGIATIFGFGVGAAIDLFKLFGGVR